VPKLVSAHSPARGAQSPLLDLGVAFCRSLALARAAFAVAIAEEPAGMFMIRQRTRVVKRHPEGDR